CSLPSERVSARKNRLPKLRPASGPSSKRNENRSRRICDSSESATKRRRSPGGSTPNASRSAPESPPLSIIVTMLRSAKSVCERRPESRLKLPAPPPMTVISRTTPAPSSDQGAGFIAAPPRPPALRRAARAPRSRPLECQPSVRERRDTAKHGEPRCVDAENPLPRGRVRIEEQGEVVRSVDGPRQRFWAPNTCSRSDGIGNASGG